MEMVQLVRVIVEQIVVCQHHRSFRKSGDDSACASHCGADRGVPVPQIMSKSGGDSACAQHRGADRGVPVPQIMPKSGGDTACTYCGTDRGTPVPQILYETWR